MKTNATCLLLAMLACGAASAQTQPASRNGQINTQINTQHNSQLNSQVNTGSAGTPSVSGVGSTRAMALPPVAPLGQTSATIGTPGVTTPLGTIGDRSAATGLNATGTTGTTGITNASGSSLSQGVTGSSAPINAGTWGTVSPNNVAPVPAPTTPSPLALPGSAPAGNPTGAAAGAPVGR